MTLYLLLDSSESTRRVAFAETTLGQVIRAMVLDGILPALPPDTPLRVRAIGAYCDSTSLQGIYDGHVGDIDALRTAWADASLRCGKRPLRQGLRSALAELREASDEHALLMVLTIGRDDCDEEGWPPFGLDSVGPGVRRHLIGLGNEGSEAVAGHGWDELAPSLSWYELPRDASHLARITARLHAESLLLFTEHARKLAHPAPEKRSPEMDHVETRLAIARMHVTVRRLLMAVVALVVLLGVSLATAWSRPDQSGEAGGETRQELARLSDEVGKLSQRIDTMDGRLRNTDTLVLKLIDQIVRMIQGTPIREADQP